MKNVDNCYQWHLSRRHGLANSLMKSGVPDVFVNPLRLLELFLNVGAKNESQHQVLFSVIKGTKKDYINALANPLVRFFYLVKLYC